MILVTSLVGMTMSARKRAARREWYGGPSHLMRMALRAHRGEPSYMETRALYRIGERLRPCPALSCEPRDLMFFLHRPNAEGKRCKICDGASVLPARRQA